MRAGADGTAIAIDGSQLYRGVAMGVYGIGGVAFCGCRASNGMVVPLASAALDRAKLAIIVCRRSSAASASEAAFGAGIS